MAQNQTRKTIATKSNRIHPIAWAISGVAVIVAVIMLINRFTGDPAPQAEQQFHNMPSPSTEAGSPAPDFKLKHVNSGERSIASYKGKVLMLNFWATWCGPCKMEIPDFIELQKEYGGKGFAILGVSLDQPGEEDAVRDFVKAKGLNYDVVMGNGAVADAYGGVRSIPTTFLIDQEGRIRAQHVGLQPKEVWVKEIEKLL